MGLRASVPRTAVTSAKVTNIRAAFLITRGFRAIYSLLWAFANVGASLLHGPQIAVEPPSRTALRFT